MGSYRIGYRKDQSFLSNLRTNILEVKSMKLFAISIIPQLKKDVWEKKYHVSIIRYLCFGLFGLMYSWNGVDSVADGPTNKPTNLRIVLNMFSESERVRDR